MTLFKATLYGKPIFQIFSNDPLKSHSNIRNISFVHESLIYKFIRVSLRLRITGTRVSGTASFSLIDLIITSIEGNVYDVGVKSLQGFTDHQVFHAFLSIH